MTWRAQDALPKTRRAGPREQAPRQDGAPSPEPPPMPLVARQRAHEAFIEEEGIFVFTREQERQLAMDGIWPEREWTVWRHAMTRGIEAYE